jgi:hypothetical protein
MKDWQIAFVLTLAACAPSHPCDPGYRVDHGACLKVAPPRMQDDADAGSDAPRFAGDYSDFGLACETQADCGGAAPFCAAPNFPLCTHLDCLTDSTICPPDWHCLDVSALSPDPTVTSLCLNL